MSRRQFTPSIPGGRSSHQRTSDPRGSEAIVMGGQKLASTRKAMCVLGGGRLTLSPATQDRKNGVQGERKFIAQSHVVSSSLW